jgi:hypothetical protein
MFAMMGGARLVGALLQAVPPGNPDGLSPDQITQISLAALQHGQGHEGVLALLVPFAFFATVILIFWIVMRKRQAEAKAREEFNKQLLDKFSSGREFGEFLESKGGKEFLAGLQTRTQGRAAIDQVLRGVRTGILTTTIGLGLLGLGIIRHALVVPGVITLAVGVGFLLSAAITKRLSNQWEQNRRPGGEATPAA